MPNAFDTQQPGRKNKQADQNQPFKPQGFNIPVGVIGLEAREKRFQNNSPVGDSQKPAANASSSSATAKR